MTESEAAQMVTEFTAAWPDTEVTPDALRQLRNLLRPYSVETVTQVLEDLVEAEQPMPDRSDLNRILKSYAPAAAKSDPEPAHKPQRPVSPWARDMPDLPPEVPDLAERMAKLRASLGAPE